VPGPIALLGSGEFTSAMLDVDRDLLAATGRARPRVAIVPTAAWPDGETTFQAWIAQGRTHFGDLGAEVEAVEIRGPEDAAEPAWVQAIGEADLVYLSGGKPGHLLASLRGTPAGAAIVGVHARGGVLAGCSAGAMVLAGSQLRVGTRRFVRLPAGWGDALALVPGTVVLPHYDAFPEPLLAAVALAAPRRTIVQGIDEETAAIGAGGTWQVRGRGRVTVWCGRHRVRYRTGDTFRVEAAAAGPDADPHGDPDEEPSQRDETRDGLTAPEGERPLDR
jgi:cyanophycinase